MQFRAAPAKLPEFGMQFENGDEMQVSGWGTTSSGGSSSDELRIVTVPFVSDDGRYLIFFSESMNITHLQKCILQTLELVQSIIESNYYS